MRSPYAPHAAPREELSDAPDTPCLRVGARVMAELRDQANQEAQMALRAAHDYLRDHGRRSPLLDDAYSAAERVMDAIDEYEKALELAHDAGEDAEFAPFVPGPFFLPYVSLPDVPLADPGDITVFPMGVGR